MKYLGCKWEKDTRGFYIFPLFCYSNVSEERRLWMGWGPWLFGVEFTRKRKTQAART